MIVVTFLWLVYTCRSVMSYTATDIVTPTSYYWGCFHLDLPFFKKKYPMKQLITRKFNYEFLDGNRCIKYCQTEAQGERNFNFAAVMSDGTCHCLEQYPGTQVLLHKCRSKCSIERNCYGEYCQVFGLCPRGKYGPPICKGNCRGFCIQSNSTQTFNVGISAVNFDSSLATCNSGDGMCTFGCQHNTCRYFYNQIGSVHFPISVIPASNLMHSPISMGVSLFPGMKFGFDGVLKRVKGSISNSGWSYLSIWKQMQTESEDSWEMRHKLEFYVIAADLGYVEKDVASLNLVVSKGDVVGVHHSYDLVRAVEMSQRKYYTLWSASYGDDDGQPYLFSNTHDDDWLPGSVIKTETPRQLITVSIEVTYQPLCPENCAQGCEVPGVCGGGCRLGFTGEACSDECPAMVYGEGCSLTCSEACIDKVCCPQTGRCIKGCTSGYVGPFCTMTCPPGAYGQDCRYNCSGNCKHGEACNPVDGSCRTGCVHGYKSPLCIDKCNPGRFGEECKYLCGQCTHNDTCRHVDGACPSGCVDDSRKLPQCLCTEGHFIKPFTQTCMETCGHCKYDICQFDGECPFGCEGDYEPPLCKCKRGYYGVTCENKCSHCNGGCHYNTGLCMDACKDGYFPFPFCNLTCEEGYFGKNCRNMCGFCANGTVCARTTGHCPEGQCAKGFAPLKCRCVVGFWGLNCEYACGHCLEPYCLDDGTCPANKDGEILCKNGYKPPFCKCPLHTWGDNCENTCAYCLGGSECSDEDGSCPHGCKANYMPPLCKDIICPVGYFWEDCSKKCGQCKDGVSCDPLTGFCPGKCEKGKQPPFCNGNCVGKFYGYSCLEECGHCKDKVACDVVSGDCPGPCETGYSAPMCRDPCPAFRYGENCRSVCGFCKDDQPCDSVSGECVNGCLPRLNPPYCTTCVPGFFGLDCKGNCSVNCKIPGECNAVSGACRDGCSDGFKPPLCNILYKVGEHPTEENEAESMSLGIQENSCFPGTYNMTGLICTEICGRCRNNQPCSEQGRCVECEDGFELPYCTQCRPGHYGFDCSHVCGACTGGEPCDIHDGLCIDGCEDSNLQTTVCKEVNDLNIEICGYRFFPPDCNSTCPDTKFGPDCSKDCGNCEDIDKCGVVDGICYSGCEYGYAGLQCTKQVSGEELVLKDEAGERIVIKERHRKLKPNSLHGK